MCHSNDLVQSWDRDLKTQRRCSLFLVGSEDIGRLRSKLTARQGINYFLLAFDAYQRLDLWRGPKYSQRAAIDESAPELKSGRNWFVRAKLPVPAPAFSVPTRLMPVLMRPSFVRWTARYTTIFEQPNEQATLRRLAAVRPSQSICDRDRRQAACAAM